jgi:ribonuclease P protein component
MVGRLIHRADFEGLMSSPVLSRSAHFALHHAARPPSAGARQSRQAASGELSTDLSAGGPVNVDKSLGLPALRPGAIWAGAMIPKRHARHAVTRNLLKRQVRQAFARHAAALPAGLWLVRLRQPFVAAQFVSAGSQRLAEAARGELDTMIAAALRRRPLR